jgi:uncharacterized phage protein (TIGR01671 family)
MQRIIKFRAWDKNKQVMVGNVGIYEDDLTRNRVFKDSSVIYDAIPMQLTGLKDKNGKEIYEGDIVLMPWGDCDLYAVFVVDFEEGCFGIKPIREKQNMDNVWWCVFLHKMNLKCEIIGNIHENPDLLEVK